MRGRPPHLCGNEWPVSTLSFYDLAVTIPTSPDRRHWWLAGGVTLVAAILPYAGTLDYPLLHDDQWAITNNPVVTEDFDLGRIFRTNAWGNQPEYLHTPNYRPLSVLTLAWTHAAAGLDPVPYRATNLVLYALVSVLVLGAVHRLGARPLPAALASCWFALHPVHVETVLQVVNREEMLCALFWLAAVGLAAGRSALVPAPVRKTWTPTSLAALAGATALAVLSKEGGAMIPFAVAGIGLLWPAGPARIRQVLPPLLASGSVVVAYLALRVAVLGYLGAGAIPWQDNPLVRASTPERLVGAFAVVWEAFRILVTPVDLSVDYGYDALGIPGPGTAARAAGGLVAVGLLVFGAVRASRSGRPLAGLGVLVVAVSWAPVSHLAFPSSILLGDRLLLLPSAGLAAAIAGFLSVSPSGFRGRAAAALVLLWSFTLLPLSVERTRDWRDAETLFASSLRNRPGSPRLHNNLGLVLLHEGRPVEAEAHLRRALAMDPTNAEAHNNLGLLLAGIGHPGSAAEEFRRALVIRPTMRAAVHNLCLLLTRVGRPEDAGPVCARARVLGVPVEDTSSTVPLDIR